MMHSCWLSSPGVGVSVNITHACRYDKPATDDLGTEKDASENHKVMYHRLGTPQEDDVFCFATPEHPTWLLDVTAEPSGRWLWVTASDGCVPANQAWVVDLDEMPHAANGAIDFNAAADSSTGSNLPSL
jgi:Prolyl oligopeptidase, N-terminal beta-propeller domain